MKQAIRWIVIVALFTIPFLPLYVSNDLFFPFITGKNFAFRILVEIALAAWAVLALMDRRYRPRFSWTLAIFGGLVLWTFVANLLGVNPHKAFWSNFERMDGWVMLAHVFALFLVAGSVLTVEKLWRRWWLFFVSVAAVVCGYGLIQLSGGAEIHQGGLRLDATFGNAIYLAVYLMFSMVIAAWLAVVSKGWVRYSLIAFIPLAGIILFFTGSRGPMLGLAAGTVSAAVLWMFLSRKDWKSGSASIGLKVAAGTLAVIVVLGGTLFLARDTAFVANDPILARAASVFSLNQELKVRSTIWGIALKGVAEDPITGWGQEGFNQVFNKYYEPSLYQQESWFDRAHNMYIDWLVAGGVPALLLFLALLISGGLALLRAPGYARAERVLLIGALVAYAVQALVVFDNLFSYVPLVLLLAIAHGAGARPLRTLEELPELRSESGVAMAAAGIGLIALVTVWTVNVPSIAAANHLVYALSPAPRGAEQNLSLFKQALADGSFGSQEIREQIVSFATSVVSDEAAPDALKVQFVNFAIDEMGKEIALSPNDARLRVQYAGAFDSAGEGERSLEQLDAALALSPKKQAIILNRGFKLYELGRPEEARAAFAHAYELDPSFDQVAEAAAAGYIVSGDIAGGKALLVEAVGTTTPDNDSVFFAYYQAKQWKELVGVAQAQVAASDGSAKSRYRLAQSYAAARRFDEARAEILATIAAHPEARAEGEALLKQIFTPAQ
jgi:O-antigen ligase/tetratricopeptide (TPR) repeat protein